MSSLSLCAVGDISLNGIYHRRKPGQAAPWSTVEELYRPADLRLGNLESPLTSQPRCSSTKFALRSAADAGALLVGTEFDLLNVANNHAMDFGPAGLLETLEQLDRLGRLHVGGGDCLEAARRPCFTTRGDQRLGLVSFCDVFQTSPLYAGPNSPGVSPLDDSACELVGQLQGEADWLIVQLHWGTEMSRLPSPEQRQMARRLVDAGADLIIGHHPHVLQPLEIIDQVPVWYSLGNFSFSSEMWRGQKPCGERFVGDYHLHPLARIGGVAVNVLDRNQPPASRLTCTTLRPDGRIVNADAETHAEWVTLCDQMQASDYDDHWEQEQERAVERRQWQTRPSSLGRKIRMRAFQFGLAGPA